MAKREDGPQFQKDSAPQQSAPQAPWLVTRDEQIRLKALELAVQTTGSPNKVELARSYMRFLKPEEDVGYSAPQPA